MIPSGVIGETGKVEMSFIETKKLTKQIMRVGKEMLLIGHELFEMPTNYICKDVE